MKLTYHKPLLILVCSLLVSIVFYISQLFYVSIDNEKSAQVYSQPLISFINQHEFLPDLISENYLVQNTLKTSPNGNSSTDSLPSKKLKAIALRTGASDIYIMNLSGTVIASSNYDKEGSFLHKNYSFRPYFQRAINDKTRQFYYAEGATTGIPGFFIASPIFINTTLHGVAVVKLELDNWEKNWKTADKNILIADKNNIVLLSTEDKWRYSAIGNINSATLKKINDQKQFIQEKHENIYSKSINWKIFQSADNAFWFINKKLYLVNRLSIPKTQWTLYYLVKHDIIFNSSLALFFFVIALSFMSYFLVKGRHHIEESKKTTQRLEIKRREELKTVMDNIHIGVMTLTPSGDIISTNPYAKDLLIDTSININEEIHINTVLSINNTTLQKLSQIFQNENTTPNYFETTTRFPHANPVPVLLSVRKVQAMDQSIYLMTVINITKRKSAEDELLRINESLEDIVADRTKALKQAQKKLIQKNKAAALGNMAATIVHELSQPLTAMSSSIGAIKAKIEKQNYDGAIESANRLAPLNNKMHDIIRLLKSFSYDSKTNLKTIDLIELIKNTVDTFKDVLHEKNVAIDITSNGDPLFIQANAIKIDLVFSNIIQNAIDAVEDIEHPSITISCSTENNIITININDNGQGVDHITIKEMFSPYFTTKEIGKGLGLGLAICYEILQEHDGTISATSTEKGACFCITLPLTHSNHTLEVSR